ncbi:DUF7547 family protein [Salinilacihabitans rarus]|uniref:DUF7547 family protein n=1 Tax=Salinilacihabitans rarus TaxID=2961596 RepID=UPI0020C90334|nr:hypothetical protein [Salinilacihabitans rarus]
MDGSDEDLAEAVRELSETLRELRRELEREGREGRERRRGRPFRFRPPRPEDLLRFADDVALPTLIALLEATLRSLEAFQRGLALVRRERRARDRTRETAETTRARADELGERALDQLDVALSELQRALSGEGADVPDDRARDLLVDARELRDEVDRRLRDATAGPEPGDERGRAIEIEDGSDDADETEADPSVDVDAELETLRERYGPEEDAEGGEGNDESDDEDGVAEDGDEEDEATDDGGDEENGT